MPRSCSHRHHTPPCMVISGKLGSAPSSAMDPLILPRIRPATIVPMQRRRRTDQKLWRVCCVSVQGSTTGENVIEGVVRVFFSVVAWRVLTLS